MNVTNCDSDGNNNSSINDNNSTLSQLCGNSNGRGAYVIRHGKKSYNNSKYENNIKMTGLENMINVAAADGHYLIDKHDSISTTDGKMVDIKYFNNIKNKNKFHVVQIRV